MRCMPPAVLTTSWLLVLTALPASAQSPVAVVEDVGGKPAGVEFMDYVASGKVIVLGSGDSLVLGYMKSCWREKIAGGTVTVGLEQGEVRGGKVERGKVDCDAGRIALTAPQAGQSAGMVFRDRPRANASRPRTKLYGLSPMVEVMGPGMLVVERLDRTGERLEITLDGERLVHRTFYDFAAAGKALTAGGIYRAGVGGKEVEFEIDAKAKPGPTPIVGRLLRLDPAR